MECKDARVALGAEPTTSAAEVMAHLEGCAACRRYREEMKQLDVAIGKAMHSPPAFVHSLAPVRAPSGTPRWRSSWALAASVLLALALGVLLYAGRTDRLSAAELVGHVAHEPASWISTPSAAVSGDATRILAASGIALDPEVGAVSYAMSCPFRGQEIPHLVVQTRDGPVTVLVLTQERVTRRMRFDEGGFTGVLLPARRGGIAVIGHTGADADAAGREVLAAIRWLD